MKKYIPLIVVVLLLAGSFIAAKVSISNKNDVVTAQGWKYTQLPMEKCAWCGRTKNLNRHHIIPQSADPSLINVKENLIVLCRDCHLVLGHMGNFKTFNPDLKEIIETHKNTVSSVEYKKQHSISTVTTNKTAYEEEKQ